MDALDRYRHHVRDCHACQAQMPCVTGQALCEPARLQSEALIKVYEKRPGFNGPPRLPSGVKRDGNGKFISSKKLRSSHRHDSDY